MLPEDEEALLRFKPADKQRLVVWALYESYALHHICRLQEVPQTSLDQSIDCTDNLPSGALPVRCVPLHMIDHATVLAVTESDPGASSNVR